MVIEGYAEGSEAVLAAAPDFTSDFPLDVAVDRVLNYYESPLQATRYYGDAFPKWWPNYGPGIVAGFLGAQVHCAPDTVWFALPRIRQSTRSRRPRHRQPLVATNLCTD